MSTPGTRPVLDAWTGAPIGRATDLPGEAAPDVALRAARSFDSLRRSPAHARASAIETAARRLRDDGEDAARTITGESGKPIRMARREVERAIGVLVEAAAICRTGGGELHPLDGTGAFSGRVAVSRRFPVGPILGITPANAPLNLVVHKVAPAIAAGCSVVVKPHERTPLSALRVRDLFAGAVPDDAIVIAAGGPELGAALVAQPQFRVLSFTGSAVGWRIAAADPTRRALLELGGNAPVIVCADADPERAAPATVRGGMHNSGQSCISAQRVLVAQPIFDRFVAALLDHCERVKLGDPHDPSVDIGPLPEDELERHERIVDAAVEAGALLLTGGRRAGRCMPPTVLANVDPSSAAWADEVFGPIICLRPYDDLDEAIALANASAFGLHAGIFTHDIDTAWRLFEALDVGGVVIGDSSDNRADPLPYGGWKRSGAGREGVRYAIDAYTDLRTMTFVRAAA